MRKLKEIKVNRYNVLDEYGRYIDENVQSKRALATVRENPGAVLQIIKELPILYNNIDSLSNKKGGKA